jgi:hypothetical protein
VHDKHPLPDLLHGNEQRVYGDSAYQIMRAAGQVEALLGLTAHTKYERPPKGEH